MSSENAKGKALLEGPCDSLRENHASTKETIVRPTRKASIPTNEAFISITGRKQKSTTIYIPRQFAEDFISAHGNRCDIGFKSKTREFLIMPGLGRSITARKHNYSISIQSFKNGIFDSFGVHKHIYFSCDMDSAKLILLTPTGEVD